MTTLTPELRLLTYRPEPMIRWWKALLDAQPQTVNPRSTLLATPALRVVVERSDIALDHAREACGVAVVSVTSSCPTEILNIVDRLGSLDSHPHRATTHPGYTRLWYRDPNGADVTLDVALPDGSPPRVDDPLFPEELDPAAVIAGLRSQVMS
ncbi:hypothetical protein [Mycolicibacterium porcinum]